MTKEALAAPLVPSSFEKSHKPLRSLGGATDWVWVRRQMTFWATDMAVSVAQPDQAQRHGQEHWAAKRAQRERAIGPEIIDVVGLEITT